MYVCVCARAADEESQGSVIYFNNSDKALRGPQLFLPPLPRPPPPPLPCLPKNSKLSAAQPLIRGYKNTAETAVGGGEGAFPCVLLLATLPPHPEQTSRSDGDLRSRL